MHTACLGMAHVATGSWIQGEARLGRRARSMDRVMARMGGGWLGAAGSQVPQAGMQRWSRQDTGQGHREAGQMEGQARASEGRRARRLQKQVQKAPKIVKRQRTEQPKEHGVQLHFMPLGLSKVFLLTGDHGPVQCTSAVHWQRPFAI